MPTQLVTRPYSGTDDVDLPDNVKALPDHAREIWVAAFNSAWDSYEDADTDLTQEGYSAAVAWSAVKRLYKQDDGSWVKRNSIAFGDGYLTKIWRDAAGVYRWKAMVSDDGVDAYATRMTIDLLDDMVARAESEGMPWLGIAHYRDYSRLGTVDKLYRDGRKLKSEGTFLTESPDELTRSLATAVVEQALEDAKALPAHRVIRTSIAFYPDAHSIEDCGIVGFTRGRLEHVAVTSRPANSRADFSIEEGDMARRSNATRREMRREDAAAVVGDELAERLHELEADGDHLRSADEDGLVYRVDEGGLAVSHDDGETFIELVAAPVATEGDEPVLRFAGSPRNKYGTHASKGFKGNYAAAWRCHFSAIGGGALSGKATGPIRGTMRRTEMIAAGMKPKCKLPTSDGMEARGGAKSPLKCSFPAGPSDYGLERWAKPSDDNLTAEDIRLTCKDLETIKRAAIAEIKRRAADREKREKSDPEDEIDLEELRSIDDEFGPPAENTEEAPPPDEGRRPFEAVAVDVGLRSLVAERWGVEPDDSVITTMNKAAVRDAAYTAGYTFLDIVMANVTAEPEDLTLEGRLQNVQSALNEFGAIIADLLSHAVNLSRSDNAEGGDGAGVNPDGEATEAVNPPPGEPDADAQAAVVGTLDAIRSFTEEGGDAGRAQELMEQLAENLERVIPKPPPDPTTAIAEAVAQALTPVLGRLEDLERSLNERRAPAESPEPEPRRPMRPPPRRSHVPRLEPSAPKQGLKGVPLSELVRRRNRVFDYRQ